MKRKYIAAGLAGAAAVLAAGCSAGGVSVPNELAVHHYQEEQNTVTVRSTETVTAQPDMAEVELTVHTEDADPEVCQQKNEEALSAVLEYLKGQGIGEASVQTSGYRLDPRYEWPDGESRVLAGYEMDTRITVSDIPMEQAGGILSGSVAAGANTIDAVRYFCSGYDEAYQEALKKAVESAKGKAEAMGEAGGFQVLEVSGIQEYGGDQSARYVNGGAEMETMAAAAAAMGSAERDMSVAPGELEIEADIQVSFQIMPR